MGKLPAFQFYPGDWLKDPDLRRCSAAARGTLVDLLCLMFECVPRGRLATGGKAWTDAEIIRALGGIDAAESLQELISKGVVSRDESGAVYSRRMVRDEERRNKWARQKREQRDGAEMSAPMSAGCPPICPQDVRPIVRDVSALSSSSSSQLSDPPNPPQGGGNDSRRPREIRKAAESEAAERRAEAARWWCGLPIAERERAAALCGWPATLNLYATLTEARIAAARVVLSAPAAPAPAATAPAPAVANAQPAAADCEF